MHKSLNAIKYFIYAGIFVIPFLVFVVSGSMFFPFITGKNFSFRIIVEVMTALWLSLTLFDARYKPRKSWVLAMLAIFVGVVALSSIFGENFYRSFWSNYERMEGLVTYLHLVAYFLVLSGMMKTEKVWTRLFNTTLFASVIMSFYALIQLYGNFQIHQGDRIDATLGNASYLAIYTVFHIFLAMALFYRAKDFKKWIYLFIIALESFVLYRTATRGAILGIIGGLLISWLMIAIASPNKKSKLKHIYLLIGVAVVVIGFMFIKTTSFVKNSPVLNRFATISLTENTTESRLTIWKMSWDGFKEKPLFGWGQENFNLVFNKYYEPILYKQEPWFDRAHNVFFDRLTTNGLFGLLSYVGLFGVALYYLWSKRKKTGLSVEDSAIFGGVFLAYFFNNLFVFDNLSSLILFVTILAYVNFRAKGLGVITQNEEIKADYGRAIYAVIIGAVAIFVIYVVNIPGILTSKNIINAFKTYSTGDAKGAFDIFQKAISYDSFGSMEAREHLSSFAIQVYSSPNLDQTFRDKVMAYTISELKKQNEQYPNDIREMIFLATVYNKAQKYDEAISLLNKAIEIAPKKQQLYFELGTSYLNKGDYENGMVTLKKSFDLDQTFEDARKIYAISAIFAGKESLAEELMKDHGSLIQDDERFLKAYAQKNNFEKITAILKVFIEKNPTNIQYRLNLAAVYLQKGQRSKSVEQLEKAIEASPSFKKQGEEYISKIKAGLNP
ncbi:MAG: O-antigen ligase family protein [Patescibacteria group bacterium]